MTTTSLAGTGSKKIIYSALFVILVFFISLNTQAQTETGTMKLRLNGQDYDFALMSISTSTSYEVNGGNDEMVLKIFWNGITSPKEIKTAKEDASPSNAQIVSVTFLSGGMPFILSKGSINTVNDNEKKVTGTFEFTASQMGLPKELGGTEYSGSGSFEINY